MKKVKHALHQTVYGVLRTILIGLVWILFRPKITYASEKAKREAFSKPRVLICNHVRGFDGAAVYSLMCRQRMTALVAKDMIEKDRLVRWLCYFLPILPIDRQNVTLSWLRDSRKLLKDGRHIMIFPEGKCQFDRVMKPFKSGCVMLAAMSGAEILPIYHNGTYHKFFGKRFRMIIGDPVTIEPPPAGVKPEELDRQAGELFAIMNGLERQLTGHVRTLDENGKVKEIA